MPSPWGSHTSTPPATNTPHSGTHALSGSNGGHVYGHGANQALSTARRPVVVVQPPVYVLPAPPSVSVPISPAVALFNQARANGQYQGTLSSFSFAYNQNAAAVVNAVNSGLAFTTSNDGQGRVIMAAPPAGTGGTTPPPSTQTPPTGGGIPYSGGGGGGTSGGGSSDPTAGGEGTEDGLATGEDPTSGTSAPVAEVSFWDTKTLGLSHTVWGVALVGLTAYGCYRYYKHLPYRII